jgi:Fe-S-cluster containining protein
MLTYECERCGKCCNGHTWLRTLIHPNDIERWKEQKREDILKYVCPHCYRFIDSEKEHEPWRSAKCPFLEFEENKAVCSIYETRPEACRKFPIAECNNPDCPEKLHLHPWLMSGNCAASRKFMKEMLRVVESKIKFKCS